MLGLFTTLSATANHRSFGDGFGTRHSLLFDGNNDEVDYTTSVFQTALADGNFKNSGSVSIWARFENTSVNGQVWDFAIDSSNRIQLQYKQSTDSLTFTFKGNAGSKTQATAVYDPGAGLEDDSTFHHILCTWDKSEEEMKLYEFGKKVSRLMEKNCPTNPSKWSSYKSQAKQKFDVYPSAYANGWAAKKYKAAGGGWKKC